jgi:hypothetical protein
VVARVIISRLRDRKTIMRWFTVAPIITMTDKVEELNEVSRWRAGNWADNRGGFIGQHLRLDQH